ncbi:Alpha/Beta hydrolase protein [Phyllosticta citricarpa]|uniref:Alpha/Beta hydrolase protein n=2 Tax=Phyllosticta TaxID=121621 RepID=A0ABR1LRT0_9PEZI
MIFNPPQTSFFTKGQRAQHGDSYIFVNQCYVQFISPQISLSPEHDNARSNLPVFFIHGGGLTGAMWDATPDRRPGWAHLAAHAPFNRPVYLIDAVDYGRSQRAPEALRLGDIEYRTAKDMWQLFRFGPLDRSAAREPFPNGQFPLAHMDDLLSMSAARRRTGDAVECAGIAAALREIGPCHVVAHSHGGALMLRMLDGNDEQAKRLVERLVLVEPWPVMLNSERKMPRTLVVVGDHVEGHWLAEELVERCQRLGAEQLLHLPTVGVVGNSHAPMCDSNSDEVGRLILEWLQ